MEGGRFKDTRLLLTEPSNVSKKDLKDTVLGNYNHNTTSKTSEAQTSFTENTDSVKLPENDDLKHNRQEMTSRRQDCDEVAASPGVFSERRAPVVIRARRDSESRVTSAGGDKAVTYVIEGGGTVSTLNRLSLDNEGDTTEDGRPIAMAHCHVTAKESGMDKKARFRLLLASFLCLIFMIGECVGGVMAHSLAVVSDAAHLLTDFASFMISLMALYLASRPATKRLSFGWYRAEILGALVSILMLWVITGVLAYSAVLRIQSGDYEINATIMLITSATGVVFNLVLGCTLHQHGHSHGGGGGGHGHSHGGGGGGEHGHGHDHPHPHPTPTHPPPETPHVSPPMDVADDRPFIYDGPARTGSSSHYYGSISDPQQTPRGSGVGEGGGMQERALSGDKSGTKVGGGGKRKKKEGNINVKAAFIHVLGDFTQSVGVLIAAIIIFFKPEWKIADPICTFLFSALVLITTITILRDILVVLMEGTPRNINFEEVRDSILDMEGVMDLHDLRVWSLTMDKTALSVHLAVERGMDPMQVVQATSRLIQHKYNITQTTIQVEEFVEEMRDCTRCQHLKD